MRNLRYPSVNAREPSARIEQIISFLRQLVSELNIETDKDTEKGITRGWSYIKRGDGSYEAYGDFEISTTQSGVGNALYISEQFLVPLPFDSVGAVVVGNVAGAIFLPEISTRTHAAFKIMSPSAISAGAKYNVRLHVNATV